MKATYQALVLQLMERQLDPDEIPVLVRNVCWIVSRGGLFTADSINKRLEELGWQAEILDDSTLRCIAEILQAEFGSRVSYYCLANN